MGLYLGVVLLKIIKENERYFEFMEEKIMQLWHTIISFSTVVDD